MIPSTANVKEEPPSPSDDHHILHEINELLRGIIENPMECFIVDDFIDAEDVQPEGVKVSRCSRYCY